MKKYLLALLLALSSTAWAYRFPIDSMEVAVLKSASFPQVTLTTDGFSWLRTLTLGWLDDGAKTVDMVQGVRVTFAVVEARQRSDPLSVAHVDGGEQP